jgi:O-antigen biosynthesis protein
VPDGRTFPTLPGFRLMAVDEAQADVRAPVRVVHPDPGLTVTFAPVRRTANDWYQFELRFPPEGVVEVLAHVEFADERVLWLRLPALARNHFLAQFRLDGAIERLALTVTGSGRLARPELRFARVGLTGHFGAVARRGVEVFKRDGVRAVWSAMNYLWRLTRPGSMVISRGSASVAGESPYDTWIRVFDEAPERDCARHEERVASLTQRPLISVLTVLDAVDAPVIDRLARSLASQIYPVWELLIAVPGSRHEELRVAMTAGGVDGARLRLVEPGPTAADSLNALLAGARGEHVLPLMPGALLRPHALLDLALTLARQPAAEAIYADEDGIDGNGKRQDPRFKPAWSPDVLHAHDYVGDLTLLRSATVRALGGWRAATSRQYDLMLRLSDAVARGTIVHLAKMLVHGDAAPAAPANPADIVRALNDHVARRNLNAEASFDDVHSLGRLHYRVPQPAPRVSLIIPTRDSAALLETCIRSIREHTRYPDYEILIIDNGSVEEETKQLFERLIADPAVRVLPRPGPFNFSRLNNSAAREATGSILALVNNDIEVTDQGWLEEMAALAARPEVGCVGARLLYSDGRLQHGGIVLGLGGVAGHAHRFAGGAEPGYLRRLCAVQNVSAVTAACLVVRKQVFDQVGGLDESLTVAFNDVDFCLKVRAAGYLNLWTPFATLVHHESVSRGHDVTPAKARRFADEYAAMQRRWGAELLHDPYYSPHLSYDREDFSVRPR